MSRKNVPNVQQTKRPLEEEDYDSDATYCSAIENCNVMYNTSPEDESNLFQLQNRQRQCHCNIEEKLKIQHSTHTDIRKRSSKTNRRKSTRISISKFKSKDAKHIQQRLANIREEVNGWLTGWGKELQRSQLKQFLAEVKDLNKAINAPSFSCLKAHKETSLDDSSDNIRRHLAYGDGCLAAIDLEQHFKLVLQEMKQVIEKLQYQLNSALNEKFNDFGNACCKCDCSCGSCNECACDTTTEPCSHKLNISSRDPRLHSVTYCSLLSSKVPTCRYNTTSEDNTWSSPTISKAETNKPSQNVCRFSVENSSSLDAYPYSVDMFETDSLCSERNKQKNNHLAQNSTKESCVSGGRKSVTNAQSVTTIHTKDSNSNTFALQNQKDSVPILSRNTELHLDCIRNQFQKCSLVNTKVPASNNTVIEEMYNGNQLSKLNSQEKSNTVNLSDITSQSSVFEIKDCRVSIKKLEWDENLRASIHSSGSELKQFSHSYQRNQKESAICDKCSITLTNNSKNPLSVDMFTSCACHIQNSKDVDNMLPKDQAKSKLYTTEVPCQSTENKQCTYSKGNPEIIPCSRNKRLQIDSFSQSNQISQQPAKINTAYNTLKAAKNKAKKTTGSANDTEQLVSLSLDMFASDPQTCTISENKSSNINKRSLKCSMMAMHQAHENHTVNISKQTKLKQESLVCCIKRIRLPCPSEYLKDSDSKNNFWNGSSYPLPQDIKLSVENW